MKHFLDLSLISKTDLQNILSEAKEENHFKAILEK